MKYHITCLLALSLLFLGCEENADKNFTTDPISKRQDFSTISNAIVIEKALNAVRTDSEENKNEPLAMHRIGYEFAGGWDRYKRSATVYILRLNERTLEKEEDGKYTAKINYYRVTLDEYLNIDQTSRSSHRSKIEANKLDEYLEDGFRLLA